MKATDFIDIVFDGPPSHDAGRFVEVENATGASIGSFGEWIERADGFWALRIPAPELTVAEMVAAVDACREALFAKGYSKPYVKIEYTAAPHRGGPAWFVHTSDPSTTPSRSVAGKFGASAAEALSYLRAAVEDAPSIWSADDVAATIGIVIAPPAIDPRDPDPSRPAPFNDHNCARCKNGARVCDGHPSGNPRNCEYLHARND